tara:strand:- start:1046 stop:3817 length:2772 start_codon:yes stop_codon:yes gene_type:complete
MRRRCFIIATGILAVSIGVAAQERRPPTTADYGQWESLGRDALLSRDGAWLAYPVTRSNRENELRVANTTSESGTVAAFGEDPAFSADSRWLAYAIGHSEETAADLRASDEPVHHGLGVLDLASMDVETIASVASFAFSPEGAHLAVHREPARNDADDEDESDDPIGSDLVVRDLDTGSDVQFANVAEFAWQGDGTLLAMTIAAEGRTGNGIRIFDAATGALRALESGDAVFTGLSWRDDADDLAALRSRSEAGFDGDTHAILVWRDLSGTTTEALAYDLADGVGFPEGFRIAADRRPTWSDDGAAVFVGIRTWEADASTDEDADGVEGDTAEPDDPAEVDVWHADDRRIIPMQRVQLQRDRARSLLSVWHLDANRFVQLGTDLMEELTLLEGQATAVARYTDPYTFTNMFGRRWLDLDLIDVETGARTKAVERVRHDHGGSATGRYLLYFKDGDFWSYDVTGGQSANLTGDVPAAFANAEFDYPTEERPAYGVAGWTPADDAVLLYDRYDLWRVAPDGSSHERLTDGAEADVRYRYLDVGNDDDVPGIDLGGPIYLSAYGQWTKQSGFARIVPGASEPERLVWRESRVSRLMKADAAERFAYVAERFDDSPDFFAAGLDLSNPRQISETNPFQADYAWGRSELVDYATPAGDRLQGALFYPADYEPGRQYPMIVYVYELRSQMVHGYVAPSERSPYNASVFTSQGYFVLQPDIIYRDRDPGVSATECVEAAVAEVLETGLVDPARVGLVGHSWGGYETAFIPTQTDTFAAAIAGAPLTNFFSMFGTIHWNQGMPESSHFETGQARMDVPYWDDMEAYFRNSPVMFITDLETPMLLAFGDADGTVDWHQGVEMYNYARRAGKEVVMLVYADENHSLRQKPNQIDYHHRVLDWFAHYLKGEDAPAWITKGVSVLDRERELEERK